jgi:CheY-like chemotaxis protein
MQTRRRFPPGIVAKDDHAAWSRLAAHAMPDCFETNALGSVLRRIRVRPWARAILLSALAGRGQATDRQRVTEAGFDHHLVKPADPDALCDLIARAAAPS